MSEAYRLQYPLGPESEVLDVGAYQGNFARWCHEKWGCNVEAFEPVKEFYDAMPMEWKAIPHRNPNGILVHPYGLGAKTERVPMSIRNDSSSTFTDPDHPIAEVEIRDVVEVFAALELGNVDLMKLNIEGGEYALLERMIETGLILRVRFLQCQWHGPATGHGAGPVDASARREAISKQLMRTHEKSWEVGNGIWESWEVRR